MFGVPGAKGVISSPPQPWIRFNDSPTPLESPLAHQPPLSHQYNQSSYHQSQHQQHQQSKVSSLSPSFSDNFSPNENSNRITNGIQLANFDFNAASIEKDPKILHPVALRVSPDGQLITYDSSAPNSGNSSCNSSSSSSYNGNSNGTGGSGNSSGSGIVNNCGPSSSSSSSLFLKSLPTTTCQHHSAQSTQQQPHIRERIDEGLTNLAPGVDRKGAFTVYRNTQKDHSSTIRESTTPSTTKESNKWLDILKAKYHPPKPVQMPRSIYDLFQNKELVDYIQDLQERCYRLETMNNELIHKMANLMEDQSYFHSSHSHSHHHSHHPHHHTVDYKRLSK